MSVTSRATYVLAIDQGTTSTRAMIVGQDGLPVASHQLEHTQILPRAGWVEHDATEIWARTRDVVTGVLDRSGLDGGQIATIGITNQRETTLVWDRRTGRPVCNAIVWQDTRTKDMCDALSAAGAAERLTTITGLPVATYFAGPKLAWILENVPGARTDAQAGHLLFGTIDTWLLWHLTGGLEGGVHLTDVTNASRTRLMDLRTLDWSDEACETIGVPRAMLPRIVSSSEVYGKCTIGRLDGVPVAGVLGDQQAALFGQACHAPGQAKNTYGTGNFMLLNTGASIVTSTHGLITTVGYRLGDAPAVYALEGSIAVTGSLVQWLRDNIGLIETAADIEALACTVTDNGGAYFVPAFSGLFAPYWRPDARGALVGLTRYVNKGHLARAVLESTAFQTADVIAAMEADALPLAELRVDGGMTANATLMQFQADLLGVDVVRPAVTETTALGSAYAAGLAVGYWADTAEVAANWVEERRWKPTMDEGERGRLQRNWAKAVQRTLNWVDEDVN